jgi:hypothetical protein
VAKGDGVQATIALENLASMLVCFRHQTLDAVGFLIRLYHPNGLLGIIQHGHDRFVSDLGLLCFGHLAVVAGGLGCLTLGTERMSHSFSQDLERHSVLLTLHRCCRMA